ncbi:MAG: UPF0182 family protein [Actinomycetaceae bacterium]|nr:UPF0182 family protein [Actinomycetaceae bacterium]MDU0970238.1 UPF0182 family protein [Actinomycetaceae bacterium]
MSSNFFDIFGDLGASGPGNSRPRGRGSGRGSGGNRQVPSISFHRPKIGPFGITVIILAIIAFIIYIGSRFGTEILWFNQIGYSRTFWTQLFASVGMFFLGVIFASLILIGNFRLAYSIRPDESKVPRSILPYREAFSAHRKGLSVVLPLLIGVMAGLSLAPRWRELLVAINGKSFGKVDPHFGIDISFFTFQLPLIDTLLSFFVTMVVIALIASLIIDYVVGAIRFGPLRVARKARVHLGVLAAILSVLIGLRYYVDRFVMMYQTGSPTDGAMYTTLHAEMPGRLILAIIAMLIAVLFIVAAFKGSWYLPAAGVAVLVVSGLVLGLIYPLIIQRFVVLPNERDLESRYIQRNIDATYDAYGMKGLQYENYTARTDATAGQLRSDSVTTSQIRLLDPEIIAPTVRQMQQSRQYYTFADQFSVDRYTLTDAEGKEEKRDTVISVRDINLSALSASQRNWVNDHTVYTHGFGVVAAYGNHLNSDGLPDYWEQGIPSRGEMGKYEERVYFSPNSPQYSIVGGPKGAKAQELDYPDDKKEAGQVRTTYAGNGGPSVGNFFSKLIYAVKFGSADLFFSEQVNSKSQILYDRDPALRVSKVAPYLTLDNKSYPAVVDMDGNPKTPKRLVWIIDGYTTSDSYPYSEHTDLDEATADSRTANRELFAPEKSINYMRNSVKAVVDAYDGSVTLYEWDSKDPVLKTWEGIYPGQVKKMSAISGDLMSHLRYPEDLFKVQRNLLTTYHVKDAPQFYTGGDQWRLSEDPTSRQNRQTQVQGTTQLQPPYYLTMKMPSQKSAQFSLTSVYVPGGDAQFRRAPMAGFLAVDSETGNTPGKVRDGYGKLRMIALPSSTTVPGPGQVQNNFNSNRTVNLELNLQDQQGSEVTRGNLLTLPVGGGLLYVQPVYIQSTGDTSYPQLRNVLVAFGDKIGFAPTLEEALDQVFGGDSAATTASSGAAKQSTDTKKQQPADANQRLTSALQDAADAMKASDEAMKKGDWSAYGDAQKKLQSAIQAAQSAQDEVNKTSGSSK